MPDENNEPTTDDQGGQQAEGQAPDDTNGDTGTPDVAALRKEAAGHRRKAREAEAERDRLAGLVTNMQRNEAERRAEQRMHRGDDLWTAGVELAELLDGEGALDLRLVDAAVDRVIKERPHWKRPHVSGNADQGARGAVQPGATSWAEALRASR